MPIAGGQPNPWTGSAGSGQRAAAMVTIYNRRAMNVFFTIIVVKTELYFNVIQWIVMLLF